MHPMVPVERSTGQRRHQTDVAANHTATAMVLLHHLFGAAALGFLKEGSKIRRSSWGSYHCS
jgi:hypothetical protein